MLLPLESKVKKKDWTSRYRKYPVLLSSIGLCRNRPTPCRTSGFIDYLKNIESIQNGKIKEKNKDIIEWCKNNVHSNWILTKALEYSIAFHNGALPRHLGSSIVDSFNSGGIRYLFCTSNLCQRIFFGNPKILIERVTVALYENNLAFF